MLIQIVDKQRRAVSVVKTALLGLGISGCSICVQVDSWLGQYGRYENYAVFVSLPNDQEPFYVTGETIVEAVRNTIDSFKGVGTKNGAKPEISEVAPF